MTTAVRPGRVGIVGCGNVTDLYLPGSARFPIIELAACADMDAGRAADLAARGVAIILISDEIGEVHQHCHRVLVMRQGRIVAEAAPARVSEAELDRAVHA